MTQKPKCREDEMAEETDRRETEQGKQEYLSDEELAARVREAEKAGILLCMTDCEVVDIVPED